MHAREEVNAARIHNTSIDGTRRMDLLGLWRNLLPDTTSLVHHRNTAVHMGLQRCRIARNERGPMAYYRIDCWTYRIDNIPSRQKGKSPL